MVFERLFRFTVFFPMVWELMCCWILVDTFCEKREYKHKSLQTVIFLGLLPVDYVAICILYDWMLVKILVSLFLLTISMTAMYQTNVLKIFALNAIYMGVLVCLDGAALFFIKSLFPEFQRALLMTLKYFAIFCISRIFLLFIVLFIRFKLWENADEMLGGKEWLGLLSIPAITIVAGATLVIQMDECNLDDFPVYIMFGMMAINIILFFLIDSLSAREKTIRDAKILYEKTKNETNMYYAVSRNLEQQRKWTHEFKNHLACISELARNGDYYELKQYTERLDSEFTESADMVNTNHVIVNAIINTKYREALEKGIVFVLKVNDLSSLTLSDLDIVTILSNLLNNAFEACEQCENKVIKLKFVMEDNQTIISVKSSLAKKLVPKNGFQGTAKWNMAGEHGTGMKNVCDVLEKYKAKYSIDYDDKEFSFSIVI